MTLRLQAAPAWNFFGICVLTSRIDAQSMPQSTILCNSKVIERLAKVTPIERTDR